MEAPWLIRTSTHSTCPLKAARSRGVRPWLFLTSRSSRDCTRTSIAWWWPWYAWKVDSPIIKLLLTLVTCTAHQKDKTKCFKLLTARCRGLTGALTSASFRMSVPEVSISWISQDTHENLIQILFPFLLHDSVPYFIYIKTTKKICQALIILCYRQSYRQLETSQQKNPSCYTSLKFGWNLLLGAFVL